MNPLWRILLCPLVFACALAHGQELKTQPTPFTAWLDFNEIARPGAARPAFPIWLESVEIETPRADDPLPKKRIRIRIRRFAGLCDELLLRLFFDDQKDSAPVVSAWTELGQCVFRPVALGSGVGLPSSETVIIPATQAAYVEIELPPAAEIFPQALLTSLRKTETRYGLDFAPPAAVHDPFDAAPLAEPASNDAFLFGRVKATLDKDPLRLRGNEDAAGTFEFEIEAQPLLAVLTFEVLNVDVTAPPEVLANERSFGPATILLPDLADPAYRGKVRPAERDVQFRYVGWLKGQKAIPGSYLRAGVNFVSLKTADRTGSVAIRSLEVQLKYASDFQPVP